jgi:CRISPR-associated protein Csm2
MRDYERTSFRNDRGRNFNQRSPSQPLNMSFLSTGYYQDGEKKKIKDVLITVEAEKLGQKFAELKLTSSQLRKFFNEVRSIEAQIDGKFDEQKALILMLKSKVAYSVGKKTSKTPTEFKDFIDACIDKIIDEKDFKGFVKFFEAVVGYFYYYYKPGGT